LLLQLLFTNLGLQHYILLDSQLSQLLVGLGVDPTAAAMAPNKREREGKEEALAASSASAKTAAGRDTETGTTGDAKRTNVDFSSLPGLDALPRADMYERSFMHRAAVTHVLASSRSDTIVTCSKDGVVKFWAKTEDSVEYVKGYRTHKGAITAAALSSDGLRLATAGIDKSVKLFDVKAYDMYAVLEPGYPPSALLFLPASGASVERLVVADAASAGLSVFAADGSRAGASGLAASATSATSSSSSSSPSLSSTVADAPSAAPKSAVTADALWMGAGPATATPSTDASAATMPAASAAPPSSTKPLAELSGLHRAPVVCMTHCKGLGCVVSADARGVLEVWQAEPPYAAAKPPMVSYTLRSDTDMLALARKRATPTSISAAPDGSMFCVTASDGIIRVFDTRNGEQIRQYDESAASVDTRWKEGLMCGIGEADLEARLAIERQREEDTAAIAAPSNAAFDESGRFLLYPCLEGIKVVSLEHDATVRVLGSVESTCRFQAVALYQGIPVVHAAHRRHTVAGGLGGTGARAGPQPDPTVFAAAHGSKRFYCLSRREPGESAASGDTSSAAEAAAAALGGEAGGRADEDRDVFNEPEVDESGQDGAAGAGGESLPDRAVVRTSKGDIHVQLFPVQVPRTVENFVGLSVRGYYNDVLFHRVIADFMLQTGDPKGDGTGGESMWGGTFEDEFHVDLRHDRPGVLSMANCGANTNGSQFFITTAPAAWLDGKHTVFGRVIKGMDVVHAIEKVKTSASDRPLEPVTLLTVDINPD
jgi:peptidylprolyl isomerase domain and WD repeat-containing protein 1